MLNMENFNKVCKGVCSRFMENEIREMEQILRRNALSPDGRIHFSELKGVMQYHGTLEKQWQLQAKSGKASETCCSDVFEQLFRAQRYFIDSYPDPSGLDQTNLSYVLSAVGEELPLESFEEFQKVIQHPSKGPFRTSLFMENYLKIGIQVGIFTDEDERKAMYWIEQSKTIERKYGQPGQKKVQEQSTPEPTQEVPPAPDAAPLPPPADN
jgi:hypothetical protein